MQFPEELKLTLRLCAACLVALAMSLAITSRTAAAQGEPAATAAATSDTTAPAPNVMCPVMPEERATTDIFSDYQGRRVHLCCKQCKREFEANPQAYLANLPAAQPPAQGEPSTPGVASSASRAISPPAEPTFIERGMRLVGRMHVMAVHFPVALTLCAALAEIILALTRRNLFDASARFCVVVAAVTGGGAAALGWINAATFTPLGDSGETLELHRWLGVALAGLLIFTAVASERWRRGGAERWALAYRAGLTVACVILIPTAHLGGSLVFGSEYFSW